MEALTTGLVIVGLLGLYLALGVWIFAGLFLVGITSALVIEGMSLAQIGAMVKGNFWRVASSWELSAIPLFVWMGELIFRTDISARMFRGLSPWVNAIPGRLVHANILGCTLFAAVCGSSTATAATIGKITTSSLIERGYDERLAIGSIAGAGTLGLMIPPSIVMIVYGILADQSIARLFAAGLFPGLLMAAVYSTYIMIVGWIWPSMAPADGRSYSLRDRLMGLVELSPILALIPIVLGGIYSGLATPSEAAALGVAGSLVIVALMRQLTWRIFIDSLMGSVAITCMVVSIIVAAAVLSSAMGYLRVPTKIAEGITYLNLGPYGVVVLLFIFYLILGCFLEGISMLVMSLPITLPLVVAAGFDPIWFGIFLVIMVEIAQITPPVGFNLYVLQGLTGRPIGTIARAALPFFFLLTLVCVIVTAFPIIALWLPNTLYSR